MYRVQVAKLAAPGCVTGRVKTVVLGKMLREAMGSCPLCVPWRHKDSVEEADVVGYSGGRGSLDPRWALLPE